MKVAALFSILAVTPTVCDTRTVDRVPNPPPASDLPSLPGDLRAQPVPLPPNLGDFIKDNDAAIALGKAFFWDMQVGSDRVQACASCHFRAFADPRSRNQLTPGILHSPMADITFHTGGPNYQLLASDFPLTRLAVPGTRGALDPMLDNDDAISSMGVHFLSTDPDPDGFAIGGVKTRRVEPRNTPTVINAVFNHRQFWDGRAENVFNGRNGTGDRDPNAKVVEVKPDGALAQVAVRLVDSSLASQAVVPIVSGFEMAAPGRTMLDVALSLLCTTKERPRRHDSYSASISDFRGPRHKEVCVKPLAKQKVHRKDSVLGRLSRFPRPGLKADSYDELIKRAFHERWWKSRTLVLEAADGSVMFPEHQDGDPATREATLMQHNFALFFGLSVQAYEATLIADNTPWDRFRRENPAPDDPDLNPWTNVFPRHISRFALFGAHLFNDRTRGPTNLRCSNCHEQAEMTDASSRRINAAADGPVRNRDGNIIDKGFNNIGVRPTTDDLGVGGTDALGPLSHARRLFPGVPPAEFGGAPVDKGFGLEGAFKIPQLRNVALTAPFFHNGDVATLRDVVDFYSRGGNVAPIMTTDGSLVEPLGVPLMSDLEIDAVVAWLETLTDERVVKQQAPFDHPQLFVPDGHPGDHNATVDADGDGFADDLFLEVPEVGRDGGPLGPGFLE